MQNAKAVIKEPAQKRTCAHTGLQIRKKLHLGKIIFDSNELASCHSSSDYGLTFGFRGHNIEAITPGMDKTTPFMSGTI